MALRLPLMVSPANAGKLRAWTARAGLGRRRGDGWGWLDVRDGAEAFRLALTAGVHGGARGARGRDHDIPGRCRPTELLARYAPGVPVDRRPIRTMRRPSTRAAPASCSASSPGTHAPEERELMRITTVETFVLDERQVLVRIGTDEGVAGWGDASLEHRPGTRGRGHPGAVGRTSSAPTRCRSPRSGSGMTRGGFYRGGAVLSSAVAGLDQALWDLRGQWFGRPVHVLLGGPCRDRVRMYTHAWGDADAHRRSRTGPGCSSRERGYTLVKASIAGPVGFLDAPARSARFVADLEALREAVGPGADFGIDLHGRVSLPPRPPPGRRGRATPLPAFFEEPVRPEHQRLIWPARRFDHRSRSRPASACSAGRSSCRCWRPASPSRSRTRPHAGGITEVFRIAALAEAYDVQLAPHCPLGPVALAACLQLDLAVPELLRAGARHRPDSAAIRRTCASCATPRCSSRWRATSNG